MITLKTLRWDNCFSYGKGNILDLNSSNLTQLVGTNGMGKSSIPLIIEEVLFNKNSKGIKDKNIRFFIGDVLGAITFVIWLMIMFNVLKDRRLYPVHDD